MEVEKITSLLQDIQHEQKFLKTLIENTATKMDLHDSKVKGITKKLGKALKAFQESSIHSCWAKNSFDELGSSIKDIKIQMEEDKTEKESMKKEIEVLSQLLVHGLDIKTFDLSNIFPEAYDRITELDIKRASATTAVGST